MARSDIENDAGAPFVAQIFDCHLMIRHRLDLPARDVAAGVERFTLQDDL
jgi:hypothetical protein